MGIGRELKRIRLESKVTQGELAEMAGISPQNISDIEREKHLPSAYTLLQIVDVLGYRIEIVRKGK